MISSVKLGVMETETSSTWHQYTAKMDKALTFASETLSPMSDQQVRSGVNLANRNR
jgi:hypothetical protein